VRRRPRRPRRATLANPAGLTARELDVLAKLGVRSRQEATRAAAARGIVPGDG
jgi:DNA-binding CsgD family transcriptional regulator